MRNWAGPLLLAGAVLALAPAARASAPSAVSTLAAAQDATIVTSSVSWVTVSWTSTGENGSAGALLAGAAYDLRWSTYAMTTEAAYDAASFRSTFPAAGAAASPVSRTVAVTPDRTWFFVLKTTNSAGETSGVSNVPSASAQALQILVSTVAPAGLLQGETTAFLKISLWVDAGSMRWRTLRLGKFGTLADGSLSLAALYRDSNENGIFDGSGTDALTSNALPFVSSRAALSLSGGSGELITTSTKTFFAALTANSTFLPVEGSSLAVFLDGEAFSVTGGGVQAPSFPGYNLSMADAVRSCVGLACDVVGDLTLESWFRATAGGYLVTYTNDAVGYRLQVNGTLRGRIGATMIASPRNVTDGRWHHGAVVVEGSAIRLYVDGLLENSGAGTLTSYSNSFQLGGLGFLGDIDEVRISTYAVYSQSFIPERRASTGPLTAMALRFDVADSTSTTIKDASPFGLDLKASNVTSWSGGAGRSSATALSDVSDVLYSTSSDALTSDLVRGDADVPFLFMRLWTAQDHVAMRGLSVERLGTGADSAFAALRLHLDDGDGVFQPWLDTQVGSDVAFLGGKATFTFTASEQVIGTSTRSYWIAGDVSVGAAAGATMGLRVSATDQFVLAGSTDTIAAAGFPAASGLGAVSVARGNAYTGSSTGTWITTNTVVFQGQFGSGNVGYYRYRWNRTAVDPVTAGDQDWTVGHATMSATSDATDWYFHVLSYDVFDAPGTQQDLGPFWIDASSPTSGAFAALNSTGGAVTQAQFIDVSSGVTVRLNVSDAFSGLAVSTESLPFVGDSRNDIQGGDSYGVAYTTNAGQTWVRYSSFTQVYATGVNSNHTAARFNGNMYFSRSTNLYRSADGDSWSLINTFPNNVGSMKVFNGLLVVGTSAGIWTSADGTTWTQRLVGAGLTFNNFGEYNGRLYAAPQSTTSLFSSADGLSWAQSFLPYTTGGDSALLQFGSVFFHKSNAANTMYTSTDAVTWAPRFIYPASCGGVGMVKFASKLLLPAQCQGIPYTQDGINLGTGGTGLFNMPGRGFAAFGGKAVQSNGNYNQIEESTNGVNWEVLFQGLAPVAMVSFGRSLYMGSGGNFYRLAPISASLTGADGTTGVETLQATGIHLVTSTNAVVCSGSGACGATNQVVFTASDRAGNSRSFGPYSILVDTATKVAISTPSYPTGALHYQPNFYWSGPSTPTAAGLGAGAVYLLQVSNDDPAFAPGNIVISISTPVAIAASSSTAPGTYLSTFTLAGGATYYWRVAARNGLLGSQSPWSSTSSFRTDFTFPAMSGYASLTSSGAVVSEAAVNESTGPVGVRIAVQDLLTGLAVSSAAAPFAGDTRSHQVGATGFGVAYSTTAGQSWVHVTTVTAAYDTGEASVAALAVFKESLYAVAGSNVYRSADGSSWSPVLAAGDSSWGGPTFEQAGGYLYVTTNDKVWRSQDGSSWGTVLTGGGVQGYTSIGSFRGRLYAASGNCGHSLRVSDDGVSWSLLPDQFAGNCYSVTGLIALRDRFYVSPYGHIPVSRDGTTFGRLQAANVNYGAQAFEMATYRNKLVIFAGDQLSRSDDGESWSQLYVGALIGNAPYAMASAGGRLFVSGANGVFVSTDAANYTKAISGLAPTTMVEFQGDLFMGGSGGIISRAALPRATLTGADGTTGVETLTANGLELVQSTNTVVCGGAGSCGATNQVRFYASDLAGNLTQSGVYAVVVDSMTVLAKSTMTFPADGSAQSLQPSFAWIGPPVGVAASIGAGRSFLLQVSSGDANFGPSSLVVSISTPMAVSTSAFTADGGYISTYTLPSGATYYARVRAVNAALGTFGPWSQPVRFVQDWTPPAASFFALTSATGAVYGEADWMETMAGVSATLTVQDTGAGLAVSTAAFPWRITGTSFQRGAVGYGVRYSTNAGATWVEYSTRSVAATLPASASANAVHGAALYSGLTDGKIMRSLDGDAWTQVAAYGAQINGFSSEGGRLYAATNNSGGTGKIVYTDDGVSWSVLFATASLNLQALEAANGRLFTASQGLVFVSSDAGASWARGMNSASDGTDVMLFRGALYVSGNFGDKNTYYSRDGFERHLSQSFASKGDGNYSFGIFGSTFVSNVNYNQQTSTDGFTWRDSGNLANSPYQTGSTAFGGRFYQAGTAIKLASTRDLISWRLLESTSEGAGQYLSHLRDLYSFNGTGVRRFSMLRAALTGSDGTKAPQTLSSADFSFITSTSAATCGGASPCAATNQVIFTVSDLAGNITEHGPFAVLVDTVTPASVPTASVPADGAFVNAQPSFGWIGGSTSVVMGLGAGAYYLLQVSDDPAFATTIINISTQAIVASTSALTGDGAYASTHTLAGGTTYYWRVAARNQALGRLSAWSATARFTTDFTSPAASGFQSLSSTGAALGESEWNDLLAGATARISVQDSGTGLAVSTTALSHGGDGRENQATSAGYGVLYSTNAGADWIFASTTVVVSPGGGAVRINSLAAHKGKLYAASETNGFVFSSEDGDTWSTALNPGQLTVGALGVFDGQLYAGTYNGARVYRTQDGSTWSQPAALSGSGINAWMSFKGRWFAGTGTYAGTPRVHVSTDGASWRAGEVLSTGGGGSIGVLAAFNGRLFAGTAGTTTPRVYATSDGETWTRVLDSAAGSGGITAMAVFNGKLYAARDQASGTLYSTVDGDAWTAAYAGPAIASLASVNGMLLAGGTDGTLRVSLDGTSFRTVAAAGEGALNALIHFKGRVFAGTSVSGRLIAFTPVASSLGGADGATSAQVLTASLNLAQSTSTAVCGGAAPCGATNQVIFSASDLAGNVTVAGPYAILADSVTPAAVPAASLPADGAFVNSQPSFGWIGGGTSVVMGLGAGADYLLQVSDDPAFAATVINISTQAVVASTSALTGDGAYVSTYTLAGGATYYWRVAARHKLFGSLSAWSATARFTTDFTSPTASGFESLSSTGAVLGEAVWSDLAAGASARISVQDIGAGLALSSSSLAFPGDGAGGASSASGYGVSYTTTAGQSWISLSSSSYSSLGGAVRGLAVFKGRLYATSDSRDIYSTADGVAWTFVTAPSCTNGDRIFNLAVFNGRLYAGGGKCVRSSADGVVWSKASEGVANDQFYRQALGVFKGQLYAAGHFGSGSYYSSADDVRWSTGTLPNHIRSFREFNGSFYAGIEGGIYSTADGAAWTQRLSGAGGVYTLAAFGGRMFAANNSGTVYSSTSGAVWNSVSVAATGLRGLTVFNGALYAGGLNGSIYSTRDGASWSLVISEPGQVFNSLAAFDGVLYAGADSGRVYALTPVAATLAGFDGVKSAQTLTASLYLAQSTSAAVCGGAAPCGATNQVVFSASDLAGNVRVSGPYAVLVDTVPPATSISGLIGTVGGLQASATAYELFGPAMFNFEASSSPAFAFGVTSSGFLSTTTFAFSGLAPATTYYVRATGRDPVGNVSAPSPSASTATLAGLLWSSDSVAPGTVQQGTEAAMLRFRLYSPNGGTMFRDLRATLGGGADSDVSFARVYSDTDANDAFDPAQDTLLGQAAPSGGTAGVALGGNAVSIGVSTKTFFLVYLLAPTAVVDAALTASVAVSSHVFVDHPFGVGGTFPAASAASVVEDGPNALSVSTQALASSTMPPGSSDQAMFSLTLDPGVGSSILSGMRLHLSGTLPSNQISAIRVYRDANANGTLEAGVDHLLSSGSDVFLAGSSTVNFTAPASSLTVPGIPAKLFVTVNLAGSATPGDVFSVKLATAADLILAGSQDYVSLSTIPVVSPTVSVLTSNLLSAVFSGGAPADMEQGGLYAVARATLTLDAGVAGVDRLTVNRAGTGVDADVAEVRVYRDAVLDGGDFNPAVDFLIGSAPFTASVAAVDLTTVSVTAGATTVVFVVYRLSPGANAGVTLAASFSNPTFVRPTSPVTTVLANTPYSGSTGTVRAIVSAMSVVPLDLSPGSLLQGAAGAAMLRLDVHSSRNDIVWSSLSLSRTGAGLDSDISAVKIYRDADADGLFSASTDTLVTTGSDLLAAGAATLAFTAPQTVTGSTVSYFLAVDVAAGAAPGNAFGLSISTSAAFSLSAPNRVSTETVAFPIMAGPVPFAQYPNTVTVSTLSVTPASGANPGAVNVPLMRLTLNTDLSAAPWTRLRIDRSGTAQDPDISAVKLWYDVNQLGAFNPSDLGQYALVTPSTVSFGSQGTAGVADVAFLAAQGLGVAPRTYFVTVDVATGAVPGRSLTARAIDKTYYTVDVPNQMAATSFTAAPLSINAPASVMELVSYSSAPASVVQGQSNAVMLSLGVWMRSYTGSLTQMIVTRSGSAADSDVTRARLYADGNANGILDIGTDILLSTAPFVSGGAALTFAAQAVTVSTRTFFVVYDVALTASAGATLGASIVSPGSFVLATPNAVSNAGLPAASSLAAIVPTQNAVTVTHQDRGPASLLQASTAQLMMSLTMNTTSQSVPLTTLTFSRLGTASDADVTRLRVYHDVDDDGLLATGSDTEVASVAAPFVSGTAIVSLSPAQAAGVTPRRYFVAVDVANFAAAGATFGLSLAGTSAIAVTAPNSIVDAGFPMTAAAVAIAKIPDTAQFAPVSLVVSNPIQGALFPVVRLTASATRDRAVWTQWRVGRTGSLADGLITALRAYRDLDGDGAIGAGDLLIGSAVLSGGTATIAFSSAQTVGITTQTYLLAVQLDALATIGATVGVSMADASAFTIASPDAVAAVGLPFLTAQASVLDGRTPVQPTVSPVGGAYASSFESLSFVWTSTVAQGSIVSAEYAVGLTAGGNQVRDWTPMPAAPGAVAADGLFLSDGSTYYISVRATSSFAFTSAVGSGVGQLLDGVRPGKPGFPQASVGQSAVLLTWTAPTAGASGRRGFLVEYQRVNRPVWRNAKTSGETGLAAAGEPRPAAELPAADLVSGSSVALTGLPSGTLLIRVRAISNAGLMGDPTDSLRVQFGPLSAEALGEVSAFPSPYDSRRGVMSLALTSSAAGEARVRIYTLFGAKIHEFTSPIAAGANLLRWDGADSSGRKVSKGVYLFVIEAGGATAKLKVGVAH